ncbi:MAG: RluA family pseudouridine synthase [Clostridia bacterium]|nr:RluA family pseudouridine synthase [Clostridia bacterium]
MDKIEITENEKGCRLDVFLAERYSELSRSGIKQLITKENIKVNNEAKKAGYALKTGDIINIDIPEPVEISLVPQYIPLDIVYQDSDLAVINKPQGLTVHPSIGHHDQTLVNALLYHFKDLSGINGELRPGIVHRLDKDTSGLMLVAKNDFAHRHLAKQIAEKTCVRKYIALLEGKLTPETGHIQTFIARSPKERKKMAVSFDSSDRVAITDYKVLQYYDDYTLANFMLKTGRTHQIRVHSAHLGHPVVGDPLYGFKKQKFNTNGQLLHSQYIEFTHPRTNQVLNFSAELPDYFEKIVQILNNKQK